MTTYTQLTADVASWPARETFSPAEIDSFIDLCEDKIRRSLIISEMRKTMSFEAVRTSAAKGVVVTVNEKFLKPHSLSSVDTQDNTIETYRYVPITVFDDVLANTQKSHVFAINDYPDTVPAYSYQGVNLIQKLGPFNAVEDAKRFVMCLLVKPTEIGLANRFVTFGASGSTTHGLTVGLNASGNLDITGRNEAGDVILHYVSTTTFVMNGWYSILIAVNMASQGQVYINDTLDEGSYPTFTDDTLAFTNEDAFFYGAATTKAYMGQFGFNSDQSLNLSVESVRRRFFDTNNAPVAAGAQGVLAFGQEADIWIPDGANHGNETGIEPNYPLVPVDTTGDFPPISNQIEFLINPPLTNTTRMRLNFYQAFPRLSSTLETHWLIENNYDLYLYGTLAEAYAFLMDDQKEMAWRQKMTGVFESIREADHEKNVGRGPNVRLVTHRMTP